MLDTQVVIKATRNPSLDGVSKQTPATHQADSLTPRGITTFKYKASSFYFQLLLVCPDKKNKCFRSNFAWRNLLLSVVPAHSLNPFCAITTVWWGQHRHLWLKYVFNLLSNRKEEKTTFPWTKWYLALLLTYGLSSSRFSRAWTSPCYYSL